MLLEGNAAIMPPDSVYHELLRTAVKEARRLRGLGSAPRLRNGDGRATHESNETVPTTESGLVWKQGFESQSYLEDSERKEGASGFVPRRLGVGFRPGKNTVYMP